MLKSCCNNLRWQYATRPSISLEAKLQLGKDSDGSLVNSTEYRCVIKILRHLTHTRSDLSYAFGMVSRYMEMPTTMHNQAVKHILRYVKGTTSYKLKYQRRRGPKELVNFIDSDSVGDIDDRKNAARIEFYLNEIFLSLGNLRSSELWHYLHVRPSSWNQLHHRAKHCG